MLWKGFQLNGNPLIYFPVPNFPCWWHSDSSETGNPVRKKVPSRGMGPLRARCAGQALGAEELFWKEEKTPKGHAGACGHVLKCQ